MMLEHIAPGTRFARLENLFITTDNESLSDVNIAYEMFGKPDSEASNIVLICTGLSTSAHVATNQLDSSIGWWERMVGPGKYIDTNHWCVICVNNLGSCKGSTGPASINPRDGRLYRADFPTIAIEDIADAIVEALRSIGINKVHCLIGVSMGGMTALAILERHSHLCAHLISISSGACSLPYSKAIRNLQRAAVEQDPCWNNGYYCTSRYPTSGMMLARKLGLLSYRSKREINNRFSERNRRVDKSKFENGYVDDVSSYLDYNADRFVCHFDANCYLYLSRAINNYCLAGDEEGIGQALGGLRLDSALIMGVSSDELFPVCQQLQLHNGILLSGCQSSYIEIESEYGHDSFLVDVEKFGTKIRGFLIESCGSVSFHDTSVKRMLAEG